MYKNEELSIRKPNHVWNLPRNGNHKTKVLIKTTKITVKYGYMSLRRPFGTIVSIVSKNKGLISLSLAVSFVRLFRLADFAMFLSDQGRDAIIVKRIVTGEHFPAIGAPTSIGQVYLGPFYYYLIAPFLRLFSFDPSGLAFAVAFYSILGLIACYLLIKKISGKRTAFLFFILAGFSSAMVESSRFSWNPNLLPMFSFLTLSFYYLMLKEKKYRYAISFGSFFAFSLQLHYLSALMILPLFLFLLLSVLYHKDILLILKQLFVSFVVFLFWNIPLLIFDLRHDFLNSKNFSRLFTEQSMLESGSLFSRLTQTSANFFSPLSMITLPNSLIIFIILFIFFLSAFLLVNRKGSSFLFIHLLNVNGYILFFSLVNSPRYPHYFGPVFFSMFFLIASLFNIVWKKPLYGKVFVGVVLILYLYANVRQYDFLRREPGNQILHAKTVAGFLAPKIGNKPFNIATWPVEFAEDHYLYFLELKGHVPVFREKIEISDQMFVLCSQKPCRVIQSPSWNISMFGRAKIATIWDVENIKIYKLVHD